ncbi:MAG TPA: succinylglutamate desuccinylase/aspartoacylase family protein [Thermoanaerobaculia bacterium]|nr:succinylglutamate desuccinylase/aspartoacylase family protein [Thermoanaerobaculia bacterium]
MAREPGGTVAPRGASLAAAPVYRAGARAPAPARPLERVLGRVQGAVPGPTFLALAGLHGNEPAGVEGTRRVLARLEADRTGLRGEVVGLAGNLAALAAGRRYLVHDLNRRWTAETLEQVRRGAGSLVRTPRSGESTADALPSSEPPSAGSPGRQPLAAEALIAEDRELRELDRAFAEVVAAADGPVFVLDLHTTSGGGPSFVVLEDTLPNRRFAMALPAPVVLGLEEELEGTVLGHLTSLGMICAGFEAGGHLDPASIDRAEAALWVALQAAGLLVPGARPEAERAQCRLAAESHHLPPVVDLRHRHAIGPGDRFEMAPGHRSFEPVKEGQTLAWDRRGPVLAPFDGLLLMPLYQPQGDDGYFLVRPVRPAWLRLSALVRRLHLERAMHLLPGVESHPEAPACFRVDRKVARWLALQLFHLLGFRRRGPLGERYLLMCRRPG